MSESAANTSNPVASRDEGLVTIDYNTENINFAPKGRKNAIVQEAALSSGLLAFLTDYSGNPGSSLGESVGKRRGNHTIGELEKYGGVTTAAHVYQTNLPSPKASTGKKIIANPSSTLETVSVCLRNHLVESDSYSLSYS